MYEVLEKVCKFFGISKDDLRSKKKDTFLVFARSIAAKELLDFGFSISLIAKILNKTHASVVYYLNLFNVDFQLKKIYQEFKRVKDVRLDLLKKMLGSILRHKIDDFLIKLALIVDLLGISWGLSEVKLEYENVSLYLIDLILDYFARIFEDIYELGDPEEIFNGDVKYFKRILNKVNLDQNISKNWLEGLFLEEIRKELEKIKK